MKTATIIVSVGITIAGLIIFSTRTPSPVVEPQINNVSVVDGKQIIEINVKGGYRPLQTIAKAGIPTIIRFKTNGTFDCSSAVRIPSLGYSQILPQTGNTDVDIGSSKEGLLLGTCGMGMYRFQINFQA